MQVGTVGVEVTGALGAVATIVAVPYDNLRQGLGSAS